MGQTGITNIKRRLDHLIDQLSSMSIEPNLEADGNAAAQLAIICGAFKESTKCPVAVLFLILKSGFSVTVAGLKLTTMIMRFIL